MASGLDTTRTRTRRRVLGHTAAALVAAACGPFRAPERGAETGPKQPATLVQLSRLPGGSERYALQLKLAADYHQVAPHVTIEVVPGAIPQEQLVVRHAGGDPVDLVENDWGIYVDLAEGRVIEDLTPYYTRDKVDPSLFVGEALTTYTWQNKRWAMPVTMSVDGLFYNEELFRAANVPLPPQDPNDRSWTLDTFVEVARKLTKPGQQFGFGGGYNCFNTNGVTDGTYFGQRAWDDARLKCLYDTPTFRRGVQFWLDAQYRQGIWPTAEELTAIRAHPQQQAFLTGKIAMNVGCVLFPRGDVAFKWGVAALPYAGPAGTKNMSGRMYPSALHMSGAGKHKEEVWAFFRWLIRPEQASRYPEVAGHSVSAIKGGSGPIQRLRQEQYGIDPKAFLLNAEGQIVSGQGMLKYPGWNDVTRELGPKYTQELKANTISADEWVRTATELIDRLLVPKK